MADEIDLATDLIDHELRQALKMIELRRQASEKDTVYLLTNEFCIECGENIPAARRELGYKRCLDCASEAERQEKMFADEI